MAEHGGGFIDRTYEAGEVSTDPDTRTGRTHSGVHRRPRPAHAKPPVGKVTAYSTKCEWCGANPGNPCYGNGPMRHPHGDRLTKALFERVATLSNSTDSETGATRG